MSESVVGRGAGRVAAIFALALLPVALLPFGNAHAGRTGTISSVEVEQTRQGETRVILEGAQDAMYTAFLREHPRRLIIDLPEVDLEGIESPIAVGEGLVTDVTVGAFGDARISPTTARVSIGLDAEAEYELEPQEDRLVVTLKPVAVARSVRPEPTTAEAGAGASEPGSEDETASDSSASPVAPAADAESFAATAESSESTAPAALREGTLESSAPAGGSADAASAAPAADPPAHGPRIVGVSEQGSSVAIESDSPLEQVDSFVLDSPDRIVIDLAGATSAIWPASQEFEQGPVRRIRVGEHPDKVRVVLDLRAPSETHTLVPVDRGVRVEIQSAALLAAPDARVADAEPVPASPAEPDSMTPSGDAEQAEPTVQLREDDPAPDASDEVRLRDDETAEPSAGAAPVADTQDSPTDVGSEPGSALEPAEATPAGPDPAGESQPAAVQDEPAAAPAERQATAPREATAATAAVEVQSIHFESLPEVDRVVLTLSQRTEAELIQPDPATVIVDLPRVSIDPAHERRVDTRDFGGPVEVFSAFRSPEIPGPNVRVAIKRTGESQPRLDWQGSQLRIEFPHAPALAEGMPPARPSAPAPSEAAPAAEGAPTPSPESASLENPAASGTLPGGALEDGDEFGGPAQPAAIDLLEEGGFSRSKQYQGRHISLDFEDAEIGNILRMIAEVSNLNVIAGEEVKGTVTIRMVDVPWDQALDVVLLTKGLGFLRIGNILRIAPVDVLHREEEARLQERRAKEKLEDLVVKLQPVNYANVKEIKDLVSHLLSPRGTVNVDSRTSTLIIKDIPTVIQEATALVKAIDTATPQVLIEAKIVEASLDFSRALGVRWGTQFNANGSDGGARDLRLSDGTNSVVPGFGSGNQTSSFVVANPISAAVGTLTLGLLSFADHLQLDLAIQAAESKKKGKVVSSPRVVTLDNREATIQQGVAIAFTSSTADSVTTTFVDAVLELKVKPHITADKSIIMKIKVSRNAPDLAASTGTVQGITKNETETEALVRDGETMVLGGIYTVDKSHTQSMFPYLADVPVLGVAFRSTDRKDVRKELLVFVTPRIVRGVTGGN